MPYIKQEDRQKFLQPAKNLGETATCAGDLNYIMTVILHSYIKEKGLRYANINEVIGALECCKLELYRAIAVPYENVKMNENRAVGVIDEFGQPTSKPKSPTEVVFLNDPDTKESCFPS